jgi:hypothetical protein
MEGGAVYGGGEIAAGRTELYGGGWIDGIIRALLRRLAPPAWQEGQAVVFRTIEVFRLCPGAEGDAQVLRDLCELCVQEYWLIICSHI